MADPLPEGVLPVIDPDGAAAASRELVAAPQRVRTGRLTRRLTPGGNTKVSDASLRRDEVRAAAMKGGAPAEVDGRDWRNQLHEGQRGKAAAVISSRARTHNSGSGFGVATPGFDPY